MATISESNGRASVFLDGVSAGLIALVFESTRGVGPVGRMIFQVLVLTPLVFLGLVAFVRCLEIAIDDWKFVTRITRLQCTCDQLVPELAPLMSQAVADDGLVAMLSPKWQPFQKMLNVAVITSAVVGGDAGVIVFWVSRLLYLAIAVGAAAGALALGWATWYQWHAQGVLVFDRDLNLLDAMLLARFLVTGFIQPAAIAEEIWHVAHQDRSAWSFNVELRPYGETW